MCLLPKFKLKKKECTHVFNVDKLYLIETQKIEKYKIFKYATEICTIKSCLEHIYCVRLSTGTFNRSFSYLHPKYSAEQRFKLIRTEHKRKYLIFLKRVV